MISTRNIWVEIFYWFIGKRRRFVVSGQSMEPSLSHGDMILIDESVQSIQEEDVVLLQHPLDDIVLVKRVIFEEEGRFFVQGDNSKQSTDSRQFGMIPKASIIGLVTVVLLKN